MSLPASLQKNLENIFGNEAQDFLAAVNKQETPSIRLNPLKLKECPFSNAENIPWEKCGYFLPERPSYIYDPLWHAGGYYVQESSSMFLGHMIKSACLDKAPLNVLDACAAPGGKTTSLLSNLHHGSLVVANELIPKRNKILIENLCRWGYPNVIVTQADIHRFLPLTGFFDLVLVDAPCSGEGMLRRGPEVVEEWRNDTVKNCALRQKDILQHIVHLVKPGGMLIYSTCTYEPAENQEQVKWLLENGFSQPDHDPQLFPGIKEMEIRSNERSAKAYRFDLHRVRGSGFFCCLLQKNEASGNSFNFRGFNSSFSIRKKSEFIGEWISGAEHFTEIGSGDDIFSFPADHLSAFSDINSTIKITYAGVHSGTLKGKLFTPAHPLALSTIIKDTVPRWECDKETAIKYLKKEAIPATSDQQNGWLIITYKELGLGWVKNIDGRRINNYLPNEWRILK